jgi:hypothetical protein
MQASSLLQLGLTGLLAACLPLSMVWMSSDANKYRKLVWVAAFLTFDLIVFGGFTRLTDSGLGCPDWPGCYGLANPFLAHEHIEAAQAAMPTGPVTHFKAWIEMIHRYLAMGIGILIITLMAKAWLQWRKSHNRAFAPLMPTLLFGFVCLQGRDHEAAAGDRHHPPVAGAHAAGAAGVAGRARRQPAQAGAGRGQPGIAAHGARSRDHVRGRAGSSAGPRRVGEH